VPPIPPSSNVRKAEAEPAPGRAFLAAFLAWVVPGLGHFYLGKRGRALIFALLVFAGLGMGCRLDGNLYQPVPGRPLTVLATLGAMGVGAPYFVLRYVLGYAGDLDSPGYEYGTAFLLSAGLMNLLLVLDGWDIATGRKP
jgi:hypothetical protein